MSDTNKELQQVEENLETVENNTERLSKGAIALGAGLVAAGAAAATLGRKAYGFIKGKWDQHKAKKATTIVNAEVEKTDADTPKDEGN